MRKGKKEEAFAPPVETVQVRPGYEKKYIVDHEQTETFRGLNSTGYHIALGAKDALVEKFKRERKDVRVRLVQKRAGGFELRVKVPQEVKIRVTDIAAKEEVLRAQGAPLAPHAN